MKENYVFFLGGYDLEMKTIAELLHEQGCEIIDHKLTWGAKASNYKKEIENLGREQIPVLIELEIDIKLPSGTILIDHHNEHEEKQSSIVQISSLLNIELNRWQQLVSANDKGYISAMECICATEGEIKRIREADRRAQGVTQQDEKYAEESIKKYLEEKNGITIINSLTEKFSPITDRMYGKTNNLLIISANTLTYYGVRKRQIAEKYKYLVDNSKAYYGGGECGFFGLSKGKVTHEEINSIKEEIINMQLVLNEKLYSYHIFLFPFKWRKLNIENDSLKEKFQVKYFHDELLEDKRWEQKPFQLDHYDNYNEYNYFYEYVREILYDLGEDLQSSHIYDNKNLINHFEYKLDKETTYNIKLCGKESPLNLEIDSILLNVYRTGTAVLSFHLRNHKYPAKEDILEINKFGRRLFVPFFDLEPDSIFTGNVDNTDKDKILCATKKNEIPDKIWIGDKDFDNDNKSMCEDFEKYKDKANYEHGPFLLPKFIEGLFPANFMITHEKKGDGDTEREIKYKIFISPVLDDRMHVVSWYGNTELVNELKQIKECNDFDIGHDYLSDNRNKKNHYSYELSKWWYKYIYVDTSEPMHTDRFARQKLLKDNTYSRWVEWRTLFGFSRFSFVMLTSNFSDLGSAAFLVRHLQSMYYKMAELCLLQRATILSFSEEVTHVSNLIDEDKDSEQQSINKIAELYKHYILFVNKIYFREVTAQEQGIEMYDMMQKIMRLPSDVKDLDNEIDELNRFASMIAMKNETEEMKEQTIEANKLTTKAHNLTKAATIFLIPTLLAGLLGMNVLPDFAKILCLNQVHLFLISLGLIGIITSVGYILLMKFIFNEKQKSNNKK